MRIFLSVLFTVLLPVLTWSQPQRDLKFERISSGISNLDVGSIMQDRQGFLWFGTEEGLNRFDGYEFRVFKSVTGDSMSLSSNIVISIFETRDGKIWTGTYRGFSIFDPEKERFSSLELPDELGGQCAYEDASGMMWLGTNKGLYSCDGINNSLKKIEIPGLPFVTAIVGDRNGLLWISSFNGFFRYDPQTGQHKHFYVPKIPTPRATQIVTIAAQDAQGGLWITSWESGVHYFDPETETFHSYYFTGKEGYTLAGNITQAVAIDPEGRVWIANATGGMAVLQPETGHISIYKNSPDEFSLPGSLTRNVYCDRLGIIWVSTDYGIAKFNSYGFFVETRQLKGTLDISNTDFWAALVDRDGDLWVGNYSGIYRVDSQTGEMENLTQQVTGDSGPGMYAMVEDEDGTLWIFRHGSFYKVNKTDRGRASAKMKPKGALRLTVQKIILTHSLINVLKIVPVGNHELWLAGLDGILYRFNKKTYVTTKFSPDSARDGIQRKPIHCLEILPDGSFLAGIRESGLVRFFPADGSFHKIEIVLPHKTPPTSFKTIFRDKQDRIWIGTETDGLLRTDLALRSFRQYTERDGLPSMRIYQILEDAADRLWIRSTGGLSLMDIEHESFTNFGTAVGLRNPNTLGEMCRDRAGRFYVGDMGYLQIFDPAMATPSSQGFPVYITAMKEGTNALVPENWRTGLHFLYDQNYISFEFAALNFAKPGETNYAYLLEGHNAHWRDVADRRFVTLAGLQPGNYSFRVRAAGKDGIWRECTQSVSFEIAGPFWSSWWFLLACTMALVGLVYYFYRMKINRLRAEIAIRNSIAQDLHDDVGSTLSGVNVFSALALQKLKTQPEATAALLAQIAQKTTSMSDAMSDIVWSINPKNDSVQNLVVRMKECAAEMLEPRDIRYKFMVDKRLLSQKLPLNLRKDFYLIFKEAINNLSKYSECRSAKISIKTTRQQLEMVIADDGKGFDETAVRAGNGLTNMRERAAKLGGQLEIISQIGLGTTLRCSLPIP